MLALRASGAGTSGGVGGGGKRWRFSPQWSMFIACFKITFEIKGFRWKNYVFFDDSLQLSSFLLALWRATKKYENYLGTCHNTVLATSEKCGFSDWGRYGMNRNGFVSKKPHINTLVL